MNIRFLFAALVSALALGSCGGNARTELFNGKDLAGWVCVVDSLGEVPAGEVFTVRDGNIRIAGQPFGYMRTVRQYGDYRLHAEWRWIGEATNSGIFQRVQEGDKVWPQGIECQLMAGRAGDLVLLGGARADGIEPVGKIPYKGAYRRCRLREACRRVERGRDRLPGRPDGRLYQRRVAERMFGYEPYRATLRSRAKAAPWSSVMSTSPM